jgi:hypothetical protein
MDDINIVDINKWFDEIVFKVNYTDIIEWIATCMDNFILFYVNSKIRQTEAKIGQNETIHLRIVTIFTI